MSLCNTICYYILTLHPYLILYPYLILSYPISYPIYILSYPLPYIYNLDYTILSYSMLCKSYPNPVLLLPSIMKGWIGWVGIVSIGSIVYGDRSIFEERRSSLY